MVRAQDWRLGYGPQPPLYNWLQAGTFRLAGLSVVTMSATKFATLWAGFMLFYLALVRLGIASRSAAVAVLALFLMPDVSWEAQRTLSHSVALIAMCGAFVAAAAGVLRRGALLDYAVLGLVLGFGGLSKANFWALPVAFGVALAASRPWPAAIVSLHRRGLALAGTIAAAILAGPVLWMLNNSERALASTGKLYRGAAEAQYSALAVDAFSGLSAIAGALGGGALVVLAIFALSARSRYAGPVLEATGLQRWSVRLLGLSGAIGLVGLIAVLLAMGATRVSPRWLLPVSIPAALWFSLLGRNALARRWLAAVSMLAALIAFAGLVVTHGIQPARESMDAPRLGRQVAQIAAESQAERISGAVWLLGNAALYAPGLLVIEPHSDYCAAPTGTRILLIESPGKPVPAPTDAALSCAPIAAGVWPLRFDNLRDPEGTIEVILRLIVIP